MIAHTTTYHKIREIEEMEGVNVYLLQGGQGAGKNGAMALRLLERAEDEEIFKNTITIMTDTYDNLKDGAISDFEWVFKEWGLNFYDYYNKQNKVCTWSGKKIQFRYLDDNKPNKGKGPRRGILYINEGNRVGWEAVKHYIARSKEVYVDFNPDVEFWAHKELETKDNCKKIIVTYKDNEMCPSNEVKYIEDRKDNVEWFKVYGLGQTGTYSERRIYSFQLIDEIPKNIKRHTSGMDFGVSPDPTFLVDTHIDKANLYLSEVFSQNGLMPERIKGAERMCISDKMDEVNFKKGWEIGCDSSGATEIKDLRKHGYNAVAVPKGTGSVLEGIKKMKSYNIFVTRSSENLIKGFESWFWRVDHNGEIVAEPQGHEPDGLAASRYAVMAPKSNRSVRILV